MPNITLPRPIPHQVPVMLSPARFKELFCGRRWGKTTVALDSAIDGHGPLLEDRTPMFKGAAWGKRILWLSMNYPQSSEAWRWVKRAVVGAAGIEVSESDRVVSFPGGGRLVLRSAESADSIRGAEFDGVVMDEAAFYPATVWNDVVQPTLARTQGWAIFATTPAPPRPGDMQNWFTQLYLDSMRGGWEGYACWQKPGTENTLIPAEEWARLQSTMPDITWRREILADFTASGDVLAFPEFKPFDSDGKHYGVVPHAELPAAWKRYGGHDWGRVRGATLYAALQPAEMTGSPHIIVYAEHEFRDLDPDDIAEVALARAGGRVTAVASDGIIWSNRLDGSGVITAQQRDALAEKGLLSNTIAEHYQRAGWANLVPSTARPVARKTAVHLALKEQPDGWPGLLVMDNCKGLIETLLNIQVDQRQPELVQSHYGPDDRIRDELYDALGHMLCLVGFPPQAAASGKRAQIADTYSWR